MLNLEYTLEKLQSGSCKKQLYYRLYESLLSDIFHGFGNVIIIYAIHFRRS
jgi:hypothetical protein